MKFDKTEVYLSGHWLVALINGDHTGLSDEESQQVADFERLYPCAVFEPEEYPSFTRDEISGLLADCYLTAVYTPDRKDSTT